MKITLREATLQDVNRIADIGTAAFKDDALHIALHPGIREHLPAYRYSYHLQRVRRYILRPRMRTIVAIADDGEIAGYAAWERHGDDGGAEKVEREKENLLLRIERCIVNYTDRIYSHLYPNPSVDPVTLAEFHAVMEKEEKHFWSSPERKNRWHAAVLGVYPKYQRKGVGGHLLRYGLEKALEDGVGAGLESSTAGEGLYLKSGFALVGRLSDISDKAEFSAGVMFCEDPGKALQALKGIV
ncbi:hypothetical protein RUND412_007447 [Rhizina undulata]